MQATVRASQAPAPFWRWRNAWLPGVLLVCALLLDISLYALAQRDKAQRVAEAENRLRSAVDRAITQVDLQLDQFYRTLNGLGEVVAQRGGLPAEDDVGLHRLLLRQNSLTRNARSILLIRPDGSLAAHSIQHPPPRVRFEDRDYFRVQLDTYDAGLYIGEAVTSRFDQQEVLPVSLRLVSDGGLLYGVTAASVRSDHLDETLAGGAQMPGVMLKLVLERGSTLACAPVALGCRQQRWSLDVLREVMPAESTRFEKRDMRLFEAPRDYLVAARSGIYPIYAVGTLDYTPVIKAWQESLGSYLLIGMLSNLALLYFTFYAMRQRRLRQAALDALQAANHGLEETVQRRTEALQRSESNSRQILSASPTAMLIVSRAGVITHCNARAQALFGLNEPDLIGQSVENFLPESARAAHREQRRNFWNQPVDRMMRADRDLYMVNAAGQQVPVEIAIATVALDGEAQVILAMQDISQRKQAELALAEYRDQLEARVHQRTLELAQARDDADAANRAKTAVLANIGHELRTPMHHIIGFAQVLLRRKGLDEKQTRSVEHLLSSARRLMAQIEDVLLLASLESNQLRIRAEPFAPGKLLENAVAAWQMDAGHKKLVLDLETDPALPAVLNGDAQHIAQILHCLLGNAIKFSHHGSIRLTARPESMSASCCAVRFAVSDQGIGIDVDKQAGLFSLFNQLDAGENRQYGGVGLGLALSKRLVDLMGGQIGVVSQPGAGATFWFVLPLMRVADPEAGSVQ